MWLDKAATWAMTERLGGDALVELVRLETHSCYLGDRSRLHAWGYGCGGCPACSLRKAGWDRYRPSNAGPSHPIQRFALANAKPEPWKNGNGVTRTLATDSRVDTMIAAADSDWNWRISVADIETSGPFSTFEQVDRTLILLHGGPLTLTRPDDLTVLTDPGERISFFGEETLDARISTAPAQALNLMTQRSSVHSTVRVVHGEPAAESALDDCTFRPHDNHSASPTTVTTVAFIVAGTYRITSHPSGLTAAGSTKKTSLILRAGEGVVLREAVEIKPTRASGPAGESKPWLILITLESRIDSSVATIS
jgi:environmental stress-induced protein Ves